MVDETPLLIDGDGPFNVEIRIAPPDVRLHNLAEGRVLAVLDGAEIFDWSNDALDRWRFECRSDARDFEHDLCLLASIHLCNLRTLGFSGDGAITFVAVAESVRLWPAGIDPTLQKDQDTEAGTCDGSECGLPPHPICAYQPPELSSITMPQTLVVTIRSTGATKEAP